MWWPNHVHWSHAGELELRQVSARGMLDYLPPVIREGFALINKDQPWSFLQHKITKARVMRKAATGAQISTSSSNTSTIRKRKHATASDKPTQRKTRKRNPTPTVPAVNITPAASASSASDDSASNVIPIRATAGSTLTTHSALLTPPTNAIIGSPFTSDENARPGYSRTNKCPPPDSIGFPSTTGYTAGAQDSAGHQYSAGAQYYAGVPCPAVIRYRRIAQYPLSSRHRALAVYRTLTQWPDGSHQFATTQHSVRAQYSAKTRVLHTPHINAKTYTAAGNSHNTRDVSAPRRRTSFEYPDPDLHCFSYDHEISTNLGPALPLMTLLDNCGDLSDIPAANILARQFLSQHSAGRRLPGQ